MNKDELYHFGILGQKWGVRRYQNPDGSLTPEGKKRYGSAWDKLSSEAKEETEERRDISQLINKNGSQYLKKGTKFTRYTDKKEQIDGERKYASITGDDDDKYHEYAAEGLLWNKTGQPLAKKTYEANRDLRLAAGEEVCDWIVDTIGKEGIKQHYNLIKDGQGYVETYISDIDANPKKMDKKQKEIYQSKATAKILVDEEVRRYMETNADDVIKEFKKRKYDAIVDPEDWISNIADMPIILLAPTKKDIKEVRG